MSPQALGLVPGGHKSLQSPGSIRADGWYRVLSRSKAADTRVPLSVLAARHWSRSCWDAGERDGLVQPPSSLGQELCRGGVPTPRQPQAATAVLPAPAARAGKLDMGTERLFGVTLSVLVLC